VQVYLKMAPQCYWQQLMRAPGLHSHGTDVILLLSLCMTVIVLLLQFTMFVITTIFGVIRGALSKGNDRRDDDQDWD
jgi:hypothetical protein